MKNPKELTYVFIVTSIIIIGLFAARIMMKFDENNNFYRLSQQGETDSVEEVQPLIK
jgi:hypothetical protein